MNDENNNNKKSQDDFIEVDVADVEDEEKTDQEETKIDPEEERKSKLKSDFLEMLRKEEFEEATEKYMKLERDLNSANKLKEEYLHTAQMVQANFENYKKRMHKDQEWSSFQNKVKVIERFLSFYDDLERTMKVFENHPDIKSVNEAIELVFNNLKSTFESFNIKAIEPKEEPFNPQYHEAIHTVENINLPRNTIIELVSIGFILDGTVIRPAKVVITKQPVNTEDSK